MERKKKENIDGPSRLYEDDHHHDDDGGIFSSKDWGWFAGNLLKGFEVGSRSSKSSGGEKTIERCAKFEQNYFTELTVPAKAILFAAFLLTVALVSFLLKKIARKRAMRTIETSITSFRTNMARINARTRGRSRTFSTENLGRSRTFSTENMMAPTNSRPPRGRSRTFSMDSVVESGKDMLDRLRTSTVSSALIAPPEKERRAYSFEDPFRTSSLDQQSFQVDEHAFFGDDEYQPTVAYHGPGASTIFYETWAPPSTWREASRAILPSNENYSLTRILSLDLEAGSRNYISTNGSENELALGTASYASLTISEQKRRPTKKGGVQNNLKNSWTLPCTDFCVQTKAPADGGILHLYVKGSAREDWMEYTFTSASSAAQFQIDLIATQIMGNAINDMYHALQLIHQGSMAYAGQEFVLHGNNDKKTASENESNTDGNNGDKSVGIPVGIAWDDAMRCLGSHFSSVRLQLESVWWLHTTSRQQGEKNINNESTIDDNSRQTQSLTSEYFKKRLLIGPVDFFRFFVPTLSETSVPFVESSRYHMERFLRWQKRVTQASVLVLAYTRAHTIANRGWKLLLPEPENYLVRRLAYDDNTDNLIRDAAAKNEYYEGTVTRDVHCQVRNVDFLTNQPWWKFDLVKPLPTISMYQGYTVVGMHLFSLPKDSKKCDLHHTKDPLKVLPSLQALVEENDQDHFIISAVFHERNRFAVVTVFVRSLPVGVDPKFDTVVDRYINGDEGTRDRKLELIVQLGTDMIVLSFVSWIIISFLSFLIRVSLRRGSMRTPQSDSMSDRTSIPAVKVATIGETHHFGGALQSDSGLPLNYVAHTLHIDSKQKKNLVGRIILSYVERNLGKDVLDFSYVLAGEREDELPERVLTSNRFVHVEPRDVALSVKHTFKCTRASKRYVESMDTTETMSDRDREWSNRLVQIFFIDPLVAAISPLSPQAKTTKARGGRARPLVRSRQESIATIQSRDPFQNAVNELIEILEAVKVPIRKVQVDSCEPCVRLNTSAADSAIDGNMQDGLAHVSVLTRLSREDILRYFIASNCNLKRAAVRIVESASWRGLTFPIDTRICRVELQNGQFFQQGVDLKGHPVFYFRHTCLGPWRKNENAVIAAILHRLESSLKELAKSNPLVQCTFIVLMGGPFRRKKKKNEIADSENPKECEETKEETAGQSASESTPAPPTSGNGDSDSSTSPKRPRVLFAQSNSEYEYDADEVEEVELEEVEFEDEHEETDDESDEEGDNDKDVEDAQAQINNPRISEDEKYYSHANKRMICRLIDVLLAHYPERLYRGLIVIGKGSKAFPRTAVGGIWGLLKVVDSRRTRDKIRFLSRYGELQSYVSKRELVSLVGGTSPIDKAVFECRKQSFNR